MCITHVPLMRASAFRTHSEDLRCAILNSKQKHLSGNKDALVWNRGIRCAIREQRKIEKPNSYNIDSHLLYNYDLPLSPTHRRIIKIIEVIIPSCIIRSYYEVTNMLIENFRCYRLTSCGVNRDCDKKGQRSDRCLIKAESFGTQRTKLELTWISLQVGR